ncbi:MAG: hypothetical protein AAF368_16650, partial [Planctomycetota bacterium]
MSEPLPDEERRFEEFREALATEAQLAWTTPEVLRAESNEEIVSLTVQGDGSVLAEGPIPDFEDYVFELRTEAQDLRLLLLEALRTPNPDPNSSHPDGAGRASHGNAVLSQLRIEARPQGASSPWKEIPLTWAWSDHTQKNGDFEAGNLIDPDARGWALDGNQNAGARTLLVLAEREFGYAEGTDLRVTLSFRSIYAQHSLGRVRLSFSPLAEPSRLPLLPGRWYQAGPVRAPKDRRGEARAWAYESELGLESLHEFDPEQEFGETKFSFKASLVDNEPVALESGLGVIYLARTIWSP